MKIEFVVIDHEGNPSWSEKKEGPEQFATYKAAEKRARELAWYTPGETMKIFEAIGEVVAPVGAIKSFRRP